MKRFITLFVCLLLSGCYSQTPSDPALPPGYKLQFDGNVYRFVDGDNWANWRRHDTKEQAIQEAWDFHRRMQAYEESKAKFKDMPAVVATSVLLAYTNEVSRNVTATNVVFQSASNGVICSVIGHAFTNKIYTFYDNTSKPKPVAHVCMAPLVRTCHICGLTQHRQEEWK